MLRRFAGQRHVTGSLFIRSFRRVYRIVKVDRYFVQLKFHGLALHVYAKAKSKNTMVAVSSTKAWCGYLFKNSFLFSG
jgi:hypothetical protein